MTLSLPPLESTQPNFLRSLSYLRRTRGLHCYYHIRIICSSCGLWALIGGEGLRVERHIAVEEEEIPEELKIVLFRVIQESFHNIAKYSQADLVTLSLRGTDHSVGLDVTDNGVGFDPAQVPTRRSGKGGLGLTSMRERVKLSGGSFSVESTTGEGTAVHALWDLGAFAV